MKAEPIRTANIGSGDAPLAMQTATAREMELLALVELQREQLAQKSELLREVNHRAKNNLQMAMALLSMQALASEHAEVGAALNSASRRLGYLARVHELLYQRGDDLQAIELGTLLADVVEALRQAFGREGIEVTLNVDLLMLSVERAINAALIVGEAVLNSFKYAFPDNRSGFVHVDVKAQGANVLLRVQDDGVGFACEARRGSLGMRLLRALGRALGGEALLNGTGGTLVTVEFPLSPASPEH